jgi:peptidoglycan-associated lipoprotein
MFDNPMSRRVALSTLCVLSATAVAAPSAAQERGTIEFGGYASYTDYDNAYGLDRSWGAGARIGAFLFPRLSVEFEGGGTRAQRPGGFPGVNVGVLAARLTAVPIRLGALSILLGAGGEHSDNFINKSYGLQALVGAKLDLGTAAALRADMVRSWMTTGDGQNTSLHLGLALYRHPVGRTTTVTRVEQAPAVATPMRDDSVSAYETQRLRGVERRYRALIDSLSRQVPAPPPSPQGPMSPAQATMEQQIHFSRDRADLSDSARRILDEKLPIFRTNPTMRIVIVGFASQPGTEAHNMALGLRRAEAAKDYLVSKGVNPSRIEIATRGEGQLLVEGPGEAANAANRRGTFRLVIADPFLARP